VGGDVAIVRLTDAGVQVLVKWRNIPRYVKKVQNDALDGVAQAAFFETLNLL
jgi:hypothetical protein